MSDRRVAVAAVVLLVAGACSDAGDDATSIPAGRYEPDRFAVPFEMEMPAGWTEEVVDEDLVLLAGPDGAVLSFAVVDSSGDELVDALTSAGLDVGPGEAGTIGDVATTRSFVTNPADEPVEAYAVAGHAIEVAPDEQLVATWGATDAGLLVVGIEVPAVGATSSVGSTDMVLATWQRSD